MLKNVIKKKSKKEVLVSLFSNVLNVAVPSAFQASKGLKNFCIAKNFVWGKGSLNILIVKKHFYFDVRVKILEDYQLVVLEIKKLIKKHDVDFMISIDNKEYEKNSFPTNNSVGFGSISKTIVVIFMNKSIKEKIEKFTNKRK